MAIRHIGGLPTVNILDVDEAIIKKNGFSFNDVLLKLQNDNPGFIVGEIVK